MAVYDKKYPFCAEEGSGLTILEAERAFQLSPDPPKVENIGKYGRMRKRYLKEYRCVLYTNLLVADKLDQHLAEIDKACEERMELLTSQMAKREGVTEALKAANQMEWVRRMNSIRNHAEEIVLNELVYC